ncbi:MAG: rhodanese-like domain-containing protein [Sediminibacterium sp.]|nr:rhodanese-like domain-containing protein [Bacteroidota bacterium]
MLNFFKSLFASKGNEDIQEQLAAGAVIIDVRSEGEFGGGHIKGSKNIPLNKLAGKLESVKKLNKPIICVCASGMRSSQATNYLKQNGLSAFNGGSWHSIKNLVQA